MRVSSLGLIAALWSLVSGCTSFATVRSAEVHRGPSAMLQTSASTPPGDEAGWFWSFDCAERCNHPVVGGDVGFTYGWPGASGAGAFALGVGVSGMHPYVDGYLQLAGGSQPFGVGARFGPPVTSWREHQLYARYDVRTGGSRLLLNPALFIHEGRSPNGENPGTFVGFVQGIGLLHEGERVSWTPAVALVAGRAQRTSYGQRHGPVWSMFGAASLGVTFHQRTLGR